MKPFIPIVILFIGLSACVVEEADLSKYTGSKFGNAEEVTNVEVKYTDSAYLVFILKAPLSRRTMDKFAMQEEFPQGVDVTFYDKSGTARSWLKSDYAVRDQVERKIIIQKNVVLENDKGERLDGPELIWDERTKEIYTDRFVKITNAEGIIYSYGFKSNEAFTRYQLNAGAGDLNIKDDKEKQE